jgi:diaminopimelate decarboxylase/arginase family enzyme
MKNNIIELIKKIYEKREIYENPTCYIYDLEEIKKSINSISEYAPSNISLYYAMKANPNYEILSYIRSFEYIKGVEIASSGEMNKALKIYSNNEIIFTGPGKTEKELELAITNKIRLINVESVVEAIRINEIAKKIGIDKVDIILRININYKVEEADEYMAGLSTKMGIDEDKYFDDFNVIVKLKHLNIKGIHVFSASGILNYKELIKYAKYVFELTKMIEEKIHKIDIIDFGGGIGIDYTGKDYIFDTKKYFYELSKLILEYSYDKKEIIMELGKYLVGTSGYYTSKIIDIKDIKGYKHIVLAGGVNHMRLPIATDRKHPIHIINMNCKYLYDKQPNIKNEIADIEGPLCMNEDKVSWNDYIENAEIGDIVVLRQAGAYCYSASTLEFLSHEYPQEIILQHFLNYNQTTNFLNQEKYTPNCECDALFVGIDHCSADYLYGVEKAALEIRNISLRYANSDKTAYPLKVYNPDRGYILNKVKIFDYGNIVDLNDLSKIDISKYFPVFVGGDHSITYSIIKNTIKEEIIVLHFDAHGDFLDNYKECPHGAVMNEVSSLKNVIKIIHIGLRGNLNTGPGLTKSLSLGNEIYTAEFIKKQNNFIIDILKIIKNKKVYISIDTDYFDPSIAPATNNPEHNGLDYEFTRKMLDDIFLSSDVIAMDFVEYNPNLDHDNVTGVLITNLIMECISAKIKRNEI